ncbi:MAG: choice-of-anchor J domain-containing protein, partial [Bacteroidota bacterium]|nr:choice-of-anchor J domain-containing protein [Bacteroidota bacterium]
MINGGTADAWTLNTSSLYSQSGSNSATIYTDFNSGNNDDYLITPQISLTGNQELTYSYRVRSSFEPQDFQILLSTTGNNALDFTDTLLANATYSNTVYETNTIDLTNYTGDVYIAFHVVSGGLDGYYLYIDDVAVESIPTCLPPTQVG